MLFASLHIVGGSMALRRLNSDEPRPEFTTDPIPKQLLFRGVENFILPLPSIGYNDSKFAQKRLVSHFHNTISMIDQLIDDTQSLIYATQESLTDAYSKNLTPYTTTISSINADLWRLRVVLFLKENRYSKRVLLEKMSLSFHHISILRKLRSICVELEEHPRLICINHPAVNRIASVLTTEVCVSLQSRIKALDSFLLDVKTEMSFIPRIFSKPEVCVQVIQSLIASSIRFRDPLTGYLAETDEFIAFTDFLRSRFSPIRYAVNSPEDSIENLIELTLEMMASFAGIKNEEGLAILNALSARYWFDRLLTCDAEFKSGNSKLPAHLEKCQQMKIGDLKPPRSISAILKGEDSAKGFFARESILSPAVDILQACIFLTNPIDIAYNVHLIHLRLAGYIAERIGKGINDKVVLGGVQFFWKLLLIAADLPAPDAIFQFIMKYSKIDCVPQTLLDRCEFPITSLKAFLREIGDRKSRFEPL